MHTSVEDVDPLLREDLSSDFQNANVGDMPRNSLAGPTKSSRTSSAKH